MVRRGLFTWVFANNISALAYILHLTDVACTQSACALVLAACCLSVCLKGARAGRSAGSLRGAMVRVWNSWVSLQWQRGLFGWPGSLLKTKHAILFQHHWHGQRSAATPPISAASCLYLRGYHDQLSAHDILLILWLKNTFLVLYFIPNLRETVSACMHLSSSCIHAG